MLAALAASAVRDVHILIRRGPAEVKFTPAELFQLSELSDTDVVVHDGETASATLRWWGTSASG